ncbi:rlmF, partial [Symbiodinium microadriaticum]
ALKNKLLLLGLEESELKRFFRALDSDGSGSMGIDEFCEGIPELFGQATAFSMLKAKKKAEKAEKQLRRLKDKLGHPPDRLTTLEPPKSAGELELQDDIRNLQVEVETRLAKLDETVKTSLKHVERIGEVLGTL